MEEQCPLCGAIVKMVRGPRGQGLHLRQHQIPYDAPRMLRLYAERGWCPNTDVELVEAIVSQLTRTRGRVSLADLTEATT